jgi:hypothetical protein
MIDMVQQALNERDHENSALRATNARLLAEMADLDQENTRCACEIFRMREENAALRLKVKELTDFPVVQAGRILDLQKENEALRAEIQALRMFSPAPTLAEASIKPVSEQAPAPEVEEKEALLEPVPEHAPAPEVEEKEALFEPVPEQAPAPEVQVKKALLEPVPEHAPAPEVEEKEALLEPVLEQVPAPEVEEKARAELQEKERLRDEAERKKRDEVAAEVARRRLAKQIKAQAAQEAARIQKAAEEKAQAAQEAARIQQAAEEKAQAAQEAARLQQAAEEKAKAELQEKERLRDEAERKKRDEVAAEVARRRLANQIKAQAAKEAARIQQAAEEKAKAELQEQRRLQAKAERKKLDEQKLQSASRATEKRKVRPVLTAADAVVQEADQYQAALNLSRVITKDPTDVSLASLLGIDQDDEDTNYTINKQVAQATSSEAQKAPNKKADKATQKPSKTASKAQELEDKTRQAQALALELSKKLGPPPSDVCRQFRKREFDAFVLKIQNIIRSTVVPSTRVFGQVSESDYIGNLTLVKLYMDERLGVTSNMQLQYQNESMYCLVFMLEDPPMSHSFTTKSVSLETIAAWMDRLDFQEACWAQYPETFTTDVLALEPETKTAIKKEFATVLKYASIHGPRLFSTGLLDGFGFPVFNVTADGDDGKPTLMDCTCIQLILWWRSGKLNDLQTSR